MVEVMTLTGSDIALLGVCVGHPGTLTRFSTRRSEHVEGIEGIQIEACIDSPDPRVGVRGAAFAGGVSEARAGGGSRSATVVP